MSASSGGIWLQCMRVFKHLMRVIVCVGVALAVNDVGAGQPDKTMTTFQLSDRFTGPMMFPVSIAGWYPEWTHEKITVRDANGFALSGVVVRLFWPEVYGTEGCLCSGGFEEFVATDGSGVAFVELKGGDSPHQRYDNPEPVVSAQWNGTWYTLRWIHSDVVWPIPVWEWPDWHSTDYDGGPCNRAVNLADLQQFSRYFNGTGPCPFGECGHDYNNDGLCNLSDLVIFGAAYSWGISCN